MRERAQGEDVGEKVLLHTGTRPATSAELRKSTWITLLLIIQI